MGRKTQPLQQDRERQHLAESLEEVPLGNLSVTASSIGLNYAITTSAGAVSFTGPVTLSTGAIGINTTSGAPGGAAFPL